MTRRVEPELLDELSPADPYAVGSRRDILRLNAWMGHSRLMARTLAACEAPSALGPGAAEARAASGAPALSPRAHPRRVVELGAGDGRFFLNLARHLPPAWGGGTAVLVDRQSVVSPETQQAFEALGWHTELVASDVFDWISRPTVGFADAVVANLFLHHFSAPRLTKLLAEAAPLCRVFVALEPRRGAWPLTCSHLVWVIGCNRVTQNDAPVSVRAGFAGDELSRLWPADGAWALEERPAGWVSHLFVARRNQPGQG